METISSKFITKWLQGKTEISNYYLYTKYYLNGSMH